MTEGRYPQFTSAAEGRSVITWDRLDNLLDFLRQTENVPGELAEVGVYRGGSAKVIAIAAPGKLLHLFDTFQGLPVSELPCYDPKELLPKGHFSCREVDVVDFMEGCNCHFHAGFFPSTAQGFEDRRFAFVHVDGDLHTTARDAIHFFWPRMNEGGVMFFDDYGCDFTGVTEAVDEAFSEGQIQMQFDRLGYQIGAAVVK